MVKYMGLGIACLTLVLSGVTHAVQIKTDEGKCGNDQKYEVCKPEKSCDNKDTCNTIDLSDKYIKDECKKIEKDICKDVKDLKDCKSDKECKEDKHKDKYNDKKDHCKIEWKNHCDKHEVCIQDKYEKHCDLIIDRCHKDHCEPSCDPVAVPAPASAAMSGAGLIGIALMAFARARRSIQA